MDKVPLARGQDQQSILGDKAEWMPNNPKVFYTNLAKFVKILPPKSKKQIWMHSVKIQDATGQKIVGNETEDVKHIKNLMSDLIIVYCKVKIRKLIYIFLLFMT